MLRAVFLINLLYKIKYLTWVYFVPVFFFLSLHVLIIEWLNSIRWYYLKRLKLIPFQNSFLFCDLGKTLSA